MNVSKFASVHPKYEKRVIFSPPGPPEALRSGGFLVKLKRIGDAEKDLQRLEALKSDYAPPLREQIAELRANSEQGGGDQSSAAPESEGAGKPPPESEGSAR